MELRAGIVEGHWTLLAARQASRVVAQMTPSEGEALLRELGNMAPSKSSLDRLPKAFECALGGKPGGGVARGGGGARGGGDGAVPSTGTINGWRRSVSSVSSPRLGRTDVLRVDAQFSSFLRSSFDRAISAATRIALSSPPRMPNSVTRSKPINISLFATLH